MTQNSERTVFSPRMSASVKIVEKKYLAEETLCLSLEKPERFEYQAGQYVILRLPQLKEKGARASTHAMSLASAPYQDELLLIMRISQSEFKQTIVALSPGEMLEIDGPFGSLTFDVGVKPVVLIAGGIGVAPFNGMIEQQVQLGWPRSLTLFCMDKTPQDMVFLEKFQKIQNQNFTFVPTMTRLNEEEKGWQGERGRITGELIQKYVKDAQTAVFYVVGLPEMVESIKEELVKMGISKDNIKVESFTGYN